MLAITQPGGTSSSQFRGLSNAGKAGEEEHADKSHTEVKRLKDYIKYPEQLCCT